MTRITRAIQVTGGIAIDGPNEDDEYENSLAREAAEQPDAAPVKRCRYFKDRPCNCDGRGTCVEVA